MIFDQMHAVLYILAVKVEVCVDIYMPRLATILNVDLAHAASVHQGK
jgi:hypothetical protein